MSKRQAAHVGSTTAHGGAVTEGFGKVLINGNHAARMGDPVGCSVHGPGTIASGNATVMVGGKPLARLLEPVKCVPSAPGVEPLVDHGKPTRVVGSLEIYLDGDIASVPEAEMNELVDALMGDDEERKIRAMKNLPIEANLLKGKMKVVDRGNPGYPNVWTEAELTGPGGELKSNRWLPGMLPEMKYEDGDLKMEGGVTAQVVGARVTRKSRTRDDSGTSLVRLR